ncbi:MAG: DUF4139 domain-containing protein, partial [Alphaproteobacteria bacterium]|nr:DUF4139 domain-containing protein [Alphaproteobacteria bacterium]
VDIKWELDAANANDNVGGDVAEAMPDKLGVSYLTGGLNWQALYRGQLNPSMDLLSLSGKVDLQNATDRDFKTDRLRLVSGDLRINSPRPNPSLMRKQTMAMEMAVSAEQDGATSVSTPTSLGDRNVYEVENTKVVPANSSVKFDLFKPVQIPVKAEYHLSWFMPWGRGQTEEDAIIERPEIVLKLENSDENGLGIPLPQGQVGFYIGEGNNASSDAIFLVEDMLPAAQPGQKLRFNLGRSHDISIRHVQKSYEIKSNQPREVEVSYDVILENSKDKPVTLNVRDHLSGQVKILKSSAEFKTVSDQAVDWQVTVPANGRYVISYSAQVKR